MVMSNLSLVPRRQDNDKLAEAELWRERRLDWFLSLAPDRSCYKGSAGVTAMKKLRPLAHDEQAHADRTAEKIRRAQADVMRPGIVEAFRRLLKEGR